VPVAKRPEFEKRIFHPSAWANLYVRLENFGQSSPDELVHVSGVPLRFTVERNPYNKADTAEIFVDFEDLPLDSRILRGATVELFFGDTGQLFERASDYWLAQDSDALREQAVFLGVVDTTKAVVDDDHRKITLSCRDYTAYFLDAEIAGDEITYVDRGRRLSFREVLERVVSQRDTTSAMEVVLDGAPEIFPADYLRRGDDPVLGKRHARNGETVWDAIQEIAFSAGLIVYVELDRIIVREPRTLYIDGETDAGRLTRWTLGLDVRSLGMSRDLGRQHGINVQVTSYDPDAKRTLIARSPENPEDEPDLRVPAAKIGTAAKARRGKKTVRTTFRPYVVRGIEDQAHLQRVADQIREQLRHHELEVEIEANDLVDSEGRRTTALGYGDPVQVAIARPLFSVLSEPVEAQVRRLLALGYDADAAGSIALALDRLRTPFYLHRVTHRFDGRQGGGYAITIEARSRKEIDLGADVTDRSVARPGVIIRKSDERQLLLPVNDN